MATTGGQALLATFERIRIINLKHRVDRRQEITKELDRIDLPIDGTHVAFHLAEKPIDADGFPTPGTRGCFESHHAIISRAAADDIGSLLIIEDDLDFNREPNEQLIRACDALACLDWHIFYGATSLEGAKHESPVMILKQHEELVTCAMIGWKGPAVQHCARYLDAIRGRPPGHPDGGPMHVDGAYSRFRKDRSIATAVANPPLGYQRSSATDIHAGSRIDAIIGHSLARLGRRLKRQAVRLFGQRI